MDMSSAPAILSLGTANPTRRYSQRDIYEFAALHSEFYRNDRVKQIFLNSDIEYRHLSFDLESFDPGESLDDLHERFRTGSVAIGSAAIRQCLSDGGFDPSEIDYVVAVSCTGYLCPGLSSILIKEFGFRRDVQRADLLGMGCAGAMPGLQRAHDFVRAYPGKKALLLAVEICSACYYVDDSLETVVGNAICADGAAAALIGMSDDPSRPKLSLFESYLEPAYIDSVGFAQRGGRLRIILSKDLRSVAGELAERLTGGLFARAGVSQDQIDHWILHSGGRKVIDNIQQRLNLSEAQLRHSKCVLRNFGNMSSPTVLFVLQETLRSATPRPGDLGVMIAMGPGLALEGALLRW